MKRLPSVGTTATRLQRIFALLLTLVFMISAVMTTTIAWSDMSQHKTNIATGEGLPKRTNALLQKYERTQDGEETNVPVSGAEFTLYKVNDDGTATVIDLFVTDLDGQILATDLEYGEYYWQETHSAIGFLPELENGQPKKYYFSAPSEDGKPVISTAYNTRRLGKLALTKTVTNSDNSPLSEAQKAVQFEFTVTFSDGGSYAYSIDGGSVQSVASGGKIYLKSGQAAQFDNIPAGLQYEIVETPVSDYTVSSENGAGNVTEDGVTAAFINTYNVPVNSGSLTVKKTVTGFGADLGKKFTFTADIGGEIKTFELKHGESKTIDHIPYGTPYTVTEHDYSADGYTPAIREYSGTITAINKTITLPFFNHYNQTPNNEKGNLFVIKNITGKDYDKEFTFIVTFTGEGAPASPQSFTLRHGEYRSFSDIPHGVHYTVTEIDANGYDPEFTTVSGVIAGNHTAAPIFINHSPYEDDLQITVTKQVVGNAPEKDKGKLFHFILTINNTVHEFDLLPGQTSQAFTVHPGDVYKLIENDYTADGYFQSGVVNGSGVVGDTDIVITQTNHYCGSEYIDIEGVKSWNLQGAPTDAKIPDSIMVLLKNGNIIVRSAIADKDNGWKYEFKNLPKYDAMNNEIHYTVEEVRVPGWRPVVTDYNIENFYQPPVIDDRIELEKIVMGTPPASETFSFILTAVNSAPMPDSNEIRITGAGSASFGEITYTMPGTYIYTISEAEGGVYNWSYDASIYTLIVTVTENSAGQLKVTKALTKNGAPAEKALFINRYDESGETVSVQVSKIWKDNDVNRPQSVQVQLYKDGTPYGSPATLSSANNWRRVWNGLDKNSVWTVDEINVPDGYVKTISGDRVNGFVITNTKEGFEEDHTSVKVTKIWKDENTNRPKSIAAQLYKDGVPMGVPVILSDANGWTYTWQALEIGPIWTADEINVPTGYNKAVTGDAANGFVITNTKTTPDPDDREVVVSGKKTWNHGSNLVERHPDYITVIVKANDVIIMQRRITAVENWSWSFLLPKYDSEGKEIVYTVDEAQLANYVKTVDGYNLINTYKPGGKTPTTGDSGKLYLWMTLTAVSFVVLIALTITRRRRRNSNR